MELTLHLPGLLLPESVLTDTVFDLKAPALSLLLGRSRRCGLPSGWLAERFGATDPLPAAALRKVGAGGTAPGNWLCLDPVHWRVSRDGIHLDNPARLALADDEDASIRESVAPLFSGWGRLSASAPGAWELQLARPLALETCPLPEAIGVCVDPSLPGGTDGGPWRGLLAEAQILLHSHPVNRRRDQLGKPLINSLWPWGGGFLPETAGSHYSVLWSGDAVLAGLAAHAGIPCLMPPGEFQPASGRVLAVIDSLAEPAQQLDAIAWRTALLGLEKAWITPALAALKKGSCTRLQVIGAISGMRPDPVSFELTRSDLLRFWRRPRPLAALADPA